MKIAIGNDHMGVEMKCRITENLEALGHTMVNVGTDDKDRTHSALYAEEVTNLINQGKVDRGILICGTGVGMSICANKVNDIRAVMGTNLYTVKQSKEHNDTNVLTLGALNTDLSTALQLVKTWLDAKFDGTETRQYRLSLISEIEAHQLKKEERHS
ncbi:RpiB/LacA/LacB family sugar-phosphate isomerase [Photobacterium sp. ZSDE20]|uniref:RpiB/LacA/LacB family sugar-phosphate isomerase n=1 Tax=Photobacterium pectinilyticum TaxID=2906793 RepID=A0ABT1N8U8_9GAMM|nr:RpiB/LacA/LacB family sugar-phosphate isomerase [Photobacterium sp. ZSDE20]MCQ1059679.1 RpiB/LacA/LacB family sugar-phosphate isomerase [Photobacterium sp. ZSDE20]MDD1825807.1 RpiB/LacA/LacB family sugar-phosphate isomerase [Photobacterium sp. ZSDE20]